MTSIHYLLLYIFLFAFEYIASVSVPSLIFGGAFETWDYITATNSFMANATGIQYQAGFLMAINEINNKTDGIADDILPNTKIHSTVTFSQDSSFFYSVYGAATMPISNIIIGPNGDAAAAASAGVFQEYDQIQIGFSSMSSSLGKKTNYPLFIRTCADQALEGYVIGEIVGYYGWERIVVFTTNDDYGTYMLFSLEIAQTNYNFEIYATYTFFPGHEDFASSIAKALKNPAHIFVIMMEIDATSALLEQGYKAGLFREGTQIIGGAAITSQSVWQFMSSSVSIPTIMKGVIGVTPTYSYKSSSKGLEFVKRWKKQKPSVTTLSDGSQICHNDVDYYGNYLYRCNLDSTLCTGMNFSNVTDNGTNIDPYVAFAYDATYAAAYAFHWLIYDQNKTSFTAKEVLSALINNISFTGVSGYIDFSPGTSEDVLGQGDRLIGIKYNILNFNPSLFKSRTDSTGFQTILEVTLFNSFTSCADCSSPIFNTADNSIPTDRPSETLISLSDASRFTLLGWAILLAGLVFGFSIMVILNRKNRIIKSSQPIMLYLILFGGFLGIVKIFISAVYILNDVSCILGVWVTHLAFGFAFSAIIVKTWIIQKITSSKLKRVKISLNDSLINIALVMMLLIMGLFIITFFGEPHIATTLTDDVNSPLRYYYCANHDDSFSTILLVLEALTLLIAAKLAWAIRSVPDALNESKYIIGAVVVVIIVTISDEMVKTVGDLSVITNAFAVDLGIAITLNLVMLILFLPKAYLLWIGAEFDSQLRRIKKTNIVAVTTFSANDYVTESRKIDMEDDEDDDSSTPLSVQASMPQLKKGSKEANKKLVKERLHKIQIELKRAEDKAAHNKILLNEWNDVAKSIENNALTSIGQVSLKS